jgi:hypothetical protein
VPSSAVTDPLVRMEARRSRGALVLVVLLTVALFPLLVGPFFADDYLHIEVAERLRQALSGGWVLHIDSAGAWWTPPGLSVEYFRPLVVLSFAVDRLLYGEHASGYHLTNLALHAAGTWLVWGIGRRVLGPGFAAWAAAALFAIHPCHTLAVGWISGRTDVLAGVFYLAAFLAYLESRATGGGRGAVLTAGILVLFALALLSKEMALTLPVVMLGHALLRPGGEPLARRLVAPSLTAAVAAAYLALRIVVLGGFHPPPTPFAYHLGDAGLAWHLATAPLLYLADFVLFVPPDPMATEPFWRAHPLLLVLFIALILQTFRTSLQRAPDRSTAAWGLGWMAITILPVLMLTIGEHFLYLPSAGYCLLVASQLPADPTQLDAKQRRGLAIVGALVMVVCVVRTTMFTNLARESSRTIASAAAALEAAPSARRLLVEDLPVAAALAFPHAVRLATPCRDVEIEVLSLLSHVMPGPGDYSEVSFADPEHLVLHRDEGFLGSYLERALAGPHPSFQAGERIPRDGYEVFVRDASDGRVRTLAFTLLDPAHTLVLGGTEHGLQLLTPYGRPPGGSTLSRGPEP